MGLDMLLVRSRRVAGLDYGKAFDALACSQAPFTTERPLTPLYDLIDVDALLGVEGAYKIKETATVTELRTRMDVTYYLHPYEEIAYWRKAYALHGWFVAHVQSGRYESGYYEVTEAQLHQLKRLAEAVLKLSAGQVVDELQSILEMNRVDDVEEWLDVDMFSIIESVDKALSVMDWEKDILLYHAS